MQRSCAAVALAFAISTTHISATAQGTWIEVDRYVVKSLLKNETSKRRLIGFICHADMKSLVRTGEFAYINVTCGGLLDGEVLLMSPDETSKRISRVWELDCGKRLYRSDPSKPWKSFQARDSGMATRVGTLACR